MREVWIVSAARTPIGSFLGSLSAKKATELGSVAIAGAVARANLAPESVGEVYMGHVVQAGAGQAPARQAALGAGLPIGVPCTTVNKVCGSGLKSVILASQAILLGETDIAVAGGMESMSRAPHLIKDARNGMRLGNTEIVDSVVNDGLWDVYNDYHMGNCAELCASERRVSRERQDEFAIESYRRAVAAQESGRFQDEIVPVTVTGRGGAQDVCVDEEPGRGDASRIPNLRPAFVKEGGTVTAGNASSLSDGAAALVLMEAGAAKAQGLAPLARIVSWAGHAQAPEWFTTAPAGAIEKATAKAGWDLDSVGNWEINEAFAVVTLAVNDMLGLDPAKVNVNGGAVALGHPIGASGARILVTLLNEMRHSDSERGCAAICLGGGEALALTVERTA